MSSTGSSLGSVDASAMAMEQEDMPPRSNVANTLRQCSPATRIHSSASGSSSATNASATSVGGSRSQRNLKKASFEKACLSPPLWKDQLKLRCMERIRKNRTQILQRLRMSPESTKTSATCSSLLSQEVRKLLHSGEAHESTACHRHSHSYSVGRNNRTKRRQHAVFDLQRDDLEEQQQDQLHREHHQEQPSSQHQRWQDSSVEELLASGELSEADYVDIVQSIEEALRSEVERHDLQQSLLEEEEEMYQEMMEYEEASLAAMLEGLELDHQQPQPWNPQ